MLAPYLPAANRQGWVARLALASIQPYHHLFYMARASIRLPVQGQCWQPPHGPTPSHIPAQRSCAGTTQQGAAPSRRHGWRRPRARPGWCRAPSRPPEQTHQIA
eukprot:366226-Chlamydomonas_euryale.AAC.19